MKRPTKATLELSVLGAFTLAVLGYQVWRHGIVSAIVLVFVVFVVIFLLEALTAIARRLGR